MSQDGADQTDDPPNEQPQGLKLPWGYFHALLFL